MSTYLRYCIRIIAVITGQCHRKTLYLHFELDHDAQFTQTVLTSLSESVSSHILHDISIGMDSLFQLPIESYIATFNSLTWINDVSIGKYLDGIVLVSAFKGTAKLRDVGTFDQLKLAIVNFNGRQPGCIRQLLNNSAVKIWSAPRQPTIVSQGAPFGDNASRCAIRVQAPQASTISLDFLLGPELQCQHLQKRRKYL